MKNQLDIFDRDSWTKIVKFVLKTIKEDPKRLSAIDDLPEFVRHMNIAMLLHSHDPSEQKLAKYIV